MIVHFSGIPATEAQGLVGQYFSSMAVPLLMVGVSTTLSHLVMPYLSRDWEAKRYQAVSGRVNLSIKLVGMMLATGSTVIVLVAPFLFGYVFGGKYEAGLAVLPWTITFCYWKAIALPVYNYLYCVERTKLLFLSLVVGLVANIVLNALLLPRLGLLGAALGTASGCAINLVAVLYFSVRYGYGVDRGIAWVLLFPLVLCLGPITSCVACIIVLYVASQTALLFSIVEQRQMEDILNGFLAKLPVGIGWVGFAKRRPGSSRT